MIIGTAKDLIKDFIYPYQTNFNFQTLPFPIQQRFLELQKPVTKYRFSKAYFKPSLKLAYNKIYVDNLYIRRSKKCHMIYENFVKQQPSTIIQPNLSIGCNIGVECDCSEAMLSKISVLNGIYATLLSPNSLSQELSHLDYSNVKFLEIYQSTLNSNDLEIISTMSLKRVSLYIHDDGSSAIKMKEILEAVIGVPHLRYTIPVDTLIPAHATIRSC
uniref:Uncharacterized protein n=1 Tax=Panagrolaimus davidi TaxID=227884 RepID=A0A914PJX4_9BILA